MKDIQVSFLADHYGRLITEKALGILRMYYDDDLSLAEIAEKTGMSRQGVRDSLKKSAAQLCEYEEKLGIQEKNDKIRAIIEEIEKNCDGVLREKLLKILELV